MSSTDTPTTDAPTTDTPTTDTPTTDTPTTDSPTTDTPTTDAPTTDTPTTDSPTTDTPTTDTPTTDTPTTDSPTTDSTTTDSNPEATEAADQCEDAPLIIVPEYGSSILVSGDLGVAAKDPPLTECHFHEADLVFRVQLNEPASYRFEFVTEESDDIWLDVSDAGKTCMTLTGCTSKGKGNLLKYFEPGEYLVIVSGASELGSWVLEISRA